MNIAPYIAAGASVFGGLHSNRENRREARRNRQWQERMSNTAFQRMVKDLEAAGINPMLAAKLGGASTPPGAQANMQNAAKGVASDYAQVKQMKEALKNLSADTAYKLEQAASERERQALLRSQAKGQDQNNTMREPAAELMDASNAADIMRALPNAGRKIGDQIYETKENLKHNFYKINKTDKSKSRQHKTTTKVKPFTKSKPVKPRFRKSSQR